MVAKFNSTVNLITIDEDEEPRIALPAKPKIQIHRSLTHIYKAPNKDKIQLPSIRKASFQKQNSDAISNIDNYHKLLNKTEQLISLNYSNVDNKSKSSLQSKINRNSIIRYLQDAAYAQRIQPRNH